MPAQLMSPINDEKRRKMIEYALEEKAPKTYRELKKSGKLREYVLEVDKELEENFEDAHVRYGRQLPRGVGGLEAIQNRNEALRRAWEEAVAVTLDFVDPEEPTK